MPPPNPNELKMLPGQAPAVGEITPAATPSRQLSDLPHAELKALAEEYGLEAGDYKTRQALVSAVHERRQLIASMSCEAMLEVIKWGRRPVFANAGNEQLAMEIVRIRTMRFEGLSQRGLLVLARLRGVMVVEGDDVPRLVKRLKKQEGLLSRLNRKRRSFIGGLVSNMLGESESGEYRFLEEDSPADQPGQAPAASAGRPASIKEEIEDAGLIGGITSRLKRSADQYLNQKLDEIESRIDRKLDEIDRRLADWRDKEIANRLRILKITLWVSVIVAAGALLYSYIRVNFLHA